MRKKLILYELNEVPVRIFDHFAGSPKLTALKTLRMQARRYRTIAEDEGHLSPWVTWPSLHRGVSNTEHGISDFGMDLRHVDRDFPPIWKILARAGIKNGVFGSLHSYPLPDDLENFAFYVPDTFAAGAECFPRDFESFQEFNLAMAAMNGRNVSGGIALKQAFRFVCAAPGLGLRGRTAASIVAQVVSEQFKAERLVRRRTSQAQIAFDFFLSALYREKPEASFFFTNHVASSLHRYWPALFPNDYRETEFSDEWRHTWTGEIPFAISEANAQLEQLIRFVRRTSGYVLMVASSMGQAAVEGRGPVHMELIIADIARLLDWIGIEPCDWSRLPAMNPQYNLRITDAARDKVFDVLGQLKIDGTSIQCANLGSQTLRLELSLPNTANPVASFDGSQVPLSEIGLKVIDLQDAAGANAYHIPNGILLVYDPEAPEVNSSREAPLVSTLEIAPSILRSLGLNAPSYMNAGLRL